MELHQAKKRKLSRVFGEEDSDTRNRVQHSEEPLSTAISLSHVTTNGPSNRADGSQGNPHPNTVNRRAQTAPWLQAKDGMGPDIFDMQVSELLSEVLPNFPLRLANCEKLLRQIKGIIEDLPARGPLSCAEAERLLWNEARIVIPFPNLKSAREAKYSFTYSKPTNVNVIGSAALRTAPKATGPLIIDLAVTMPHELFDDKDYFDFRYFNKRAYFLATIAAGIANSGNQTPDCQYTWQNGNSLQPALLLTPPVRSDAAASPYTTPVKIQILLGPPIAIFPQTKLLPWRSCVRPQVSAETNRTSTPFYNGTLQSEALHGSYNKLIHGSAAKSPGFKAAVTLAAVWLRQRGLAADIQNGGFGLFESAALIALLTESKRPNGLPTISPGYSCQQIFRALLHFIATNDATQSPLIIHPLVEVTKEGTDAKVPILLDGTRGHNLLFKMTTFSFLRLQYEAQLTLKSLDSSLDNAFYSSFIAKTNHPQLTFDHVLNLQFQGRNQKDEPKYPSYYLMDSIWRLCRALSRGLGDRLKLLYPSVSPPGPWSTSARWFDGPQSLSIGLIVVPDHVDRIVDHGPSADETRAAASFRKFWGEKAELRRFKDGNILESLIWDQNGTSHVLNQIITYIVSRHTKFISSESIQISGNEIVAVFPSLQYKRPQVHARSTEEWIVFDNLRQKISGMTTLPLQIRQISPLFNGLHSMEPDSHRKRQLAINCPLEVVIQFESSARWPDDLDAVQRTKAAFLLKLSQLLKSSDSTIIGSLGLENTVVPFLNNAYLDLIFKSTLFRLRIHHDRELTLLDRQVRAGQSTGRKQRVYAHALAAHKRLFLQSPKHALALRSLCHKYHLLAPTIQVFKYWSSMHLLSPHFTSELLELLVIRTFTSPLPFGAPGSVQTAFLRTLAFIAKWDWRQEPLMVNTDGEMSTNEADTIKAQFLSWRKIDPALNRVVVFAGSNIDPGGITWTGQKPSKVAAARLTALARAASSLALKDNSEQRLDALFSTSLHEYDFVIHVKPEIREQSNVETTYKNIGPKPGVGKDIARCDTIQMLADEIEAVHGSSIVLFYGEGKSLIAGLWHADVATRPWKSQMSFPTVPTDDGTDKFSNVTPNRNAILSDLCRLGRGIIARIDSKDEHGDMLIEVE